LPRPDGATEDSAARRSRFSRSGSETAPLNREQEIRQAVLLAFCHPADEQTFGALSSRDWQRLLCWLDLSGLALYFFERLGELEQRHLMPAPVIARLQRNLADNTERTNGMIAESIEIQHEFQAVRLRYAVLKGLSLWPTSVSRPELRSQFDLDFLVAEQDLPEARKILARSGYRLYGRSGRSWEFKRNERPGFTRKDLYKHLGSWMVELHEEPSMPSSASVFRRLEWCEIRGFTMPVLAPLDLFLNQGRHAYKHICGEYLRASLLVEFRRHVLFRAGDHGFWQEIQSRLEDDSHARMALGMVIFLISHVMGEFAPRGLTNCTVDCLPRNAQLWIEMYGQRIALGGFPGSKLYLLLQDALEARGGPAGGPRRQSLIPLRLPPSVIRASPGESFSLRIRRYRMQLGLIFSRLRFHLVAGARLMCERRRWRQHLEGIEP
jgi:hypothetical protein